MRIFCLCFIIILCGCVYTPLPPRGESFSNVESAPIGYARVYLFRKSFTLGMGGPTQVYFDRKEVFRGDNSTYVNYITEPGCYRLTHDWREQASVSTRPKRFCFKENSVYYIDIKPVLVSGTANQYFSTMKFSSSLELVNEEEAVPILKSCRELPAMTMELQEMFPLKALP